MRVVIYDDIYRQDNECTTEKESSPGFFLLEEDWNHVHWILARLVRGQFWNILNKD